jgi:large subunit ribosomal protein L14
MVQIRSVLNVADNTGAKKVKVIHVHGGSIRVKGTIGDILTVSVIMAAPQGMVKKGEMAKAVIIRTRKEVRRVDGSYVRFDDNAVVLIQDLKNHEPKGTRVFGPVAREVKEAGFAKIASLAKEVV